ncbi:MAG: CsbD family protein, partial [Dolichospermum sp.]
AIGNVRGNKKDQFMGKAKQAESKVRNAVEDIKDEIWKQKSKSVTKDIEAKTQKAIDNSIVNPNYLPGGKTKDTKSESRNPADKMKDQIRDTFK